MDEGWAYLVDVKTIIEVHNFSPIRSTMVWGLYYPHSTVSSQSFG
jgi:hypothetical protein